MGGEWGRCGCPVAGWEDLVNVVCLGGYEGWFFGVVGANGCVGRPRRFERQG